MDFILACPCCGTHVPAHDDGFNATVVVVEACSTLRSAGIHSVSLRKSAAYAAAVPASALVTHHDGLVTLGV